MKQDIRAILVTQGAEYQAVCRGLRQAGVSDVEVLPLPIGSRSAFMHLEQLGLSVKQYPAVLLVGLCGGLKPDYNIGDVVFYEGCTYRVEPTSVRFHACDEKLNIAVAKKVGRRVSLVKGLTSDRLIWSAYEKRELGKEYNTEVVDMEGFGVLQVLKPTGIAISMMRVISDDCHRDLPDLSSAIDAEGRLRSLPLALGMMRNPRGAVQLIQGSLRGLKVLQSTIAAIFSAANDASSEDLPENEVKPSSTILPSSTLFPPTE